MTRRDRKGLTVEPIVAYPREAQVGKRYLLTIDLRWDAAAAAWPYEEEEHVIRCFVDGSPWFRSEAVESGALVVHCYGGTYGAAEFVLTPVAPAPSAEVRVTLVNERGVPLRTLILPEVRVMPAPRPARVLVAGLGTYELPQKVVATAGRLGEALARAGYGLIGRGWQGVDHIVARSYDAASRRLGPGSRGGVTHVVRAGARPDYPYGRRQVVPPGDQKRTRAVELADAVVLIAGVGSTEEIGGLALSAGKPLLPLADTGGAAARLYRHLRSPEFLEGHPHLAGPLAALAGHAPEVVDDVMRLLGDLFAGRIRWEPTPTSQPEQGPATAPEQGLLYVNGVNAATGEYLQPPLSVEDLARLVQQEMPNTERQQARSPRDVEREI
jgi:hypothetical protein